MITRIFMSLIAIISILVGVMMLLASGLPLSADVIFDRQNSQAWDKDNQQASISVTPIGVQGTPPDITTTVQIIPRISRRSH